LMTSIIFNKLEKGQFSILDFYLARCKRIIPALLVLCIILLALTWFFLPPNEYRAFGKQMVGAVTFLSNFVFLKEAGYFDTSSHEKWLLHTWSLSVEWQFYIVYPVIIAMLRHWLSLITIRWVILFFAICSFLLSAFCPLRMAEAGFYLLPTRAWEMMCGGLVYLFALKVNKEKAVPVELAGLLIIILSTVFLDSSMKWPGSLAVIPVIGAMLILIASRENSLVTGNRVSQYLGAVSYSLYLWHWPVVVSLHLLGLFHNPLWVCAGLAWSLAFAHLSYSFVEQRWRLPALGNTNRFTALGSYAAASFIITVIAFSIFRLNGIPSRVDTFVAVADQEQRNYNPRAECFVIPSANPASPMCVFGENTSKIAVVVIGDSHSNATITAVAAAIPAEQGGALFLGADGCMSMMNISTMHFSKCGDYNKKILSYLNENIPGVPVIVINHITEDVLTADKKALNKMVYLDGRPNTDKEFAPLFAEEYKRHICSIAKKRPVFIMQPIPEMGVNVPQTIVREKMYRSREIDVSISRGDYINGNDIIRNLIVDTASVCDAKVIDPSNYLCDDSKCIGSVNSRPLYYDDDHLSEYGNKLLMPMFREVWEQHLIAL
ncbi:MAG: acyltransferase, partial [Sphingobacteriales bacterium]